MYLHEIFINILFAWQSFFFSGNVTQLIFFWIMEKKTKETGIFFFYGLDEILKFRNSISVLQKTALILHFCFSCYQKLT